jgi:hypothetical protein
MERGPYYPLAPTQPILTELSPKFLKVEIPGPKSFATEALPIAACTTFHDNGGFFQYS